MTDDRYDKVTFRGRTVDKYTRASLLAVEKELGYELTIVQGSYNKGGVAASAGTHDGGGCIDLLAWDATNKVKALRRNGWVADKRLRSQGFTGDHIHAVQIGNAKVSSSARAQIAPMMRGEAGLARRVSQVIKYTPPGGYKAFAYPTAPAAKPSAPVWGQPSTWVVGGVSDDVKRLAERLVAHGYGRFYTNGTDTTFTNGEDVAAVKAFQKAQGWTGAGADGFPGTQTFALLEADPTPAPVEPTPQEPTVTDCTFNVLGLNIYASQYTGNTFSTKRKAAIKAVFADARASVLLLSEINLNRDHDTIVAIAGKQFNNANVYVRASGNNHAYLDANKWERTGKTEVDLIKRNQHRKVTLTTQRHKASGVVISFWVAHFSSAAGFRAAGKDGSEASRLAAADQAAEAKALAKILASKPLPDWDIDKSIGYVDSNIANGGTTWLDGQGTTDVYDLTAVGNAEYNSLHDLGKAAPKSRKHIDRVRVGKKVTVATAHQIPNWDASDHLGFAGTYTVTP